MTRKRLEEVGLSIGKDVIGRLGGTYKIAYAEHPYVSGSYAGISIDVVPCYAVKSAGEIKSAVDRTPFHVKYITEHLPANAAGDVRLLKRFCKAAGVYGADTKTEGFSGYVCELLVIAYGSFIEVLKGVSGWMPGDIIDVEQSYEAKDYAKLRKEFKEQPLILIDPTDKKRNTAAAISAESFHLLKKAAVRFLAGPSKDIFFPEPAEPITEAEFIKRHNERRTGLMLLKFAPPDVVPDILWPQLRRTAERLESILTENDFVVLRRGVYSDESGTAAILLEMEIDELPKVQKRVGPKIFDADDSERFIEKYKPQAVAGPFVEDNFWVVEVRRKFLTAQDKLADSLHETVEILEAKGIPSHVAEQLAKGFDIITDTRKMMALARKDKNFGIFLRKYFEKESLV
jgi:tRNA nucleotidyltransferase (CCA-adding enzyme)